MVTHEGFPFPFHISFQTQTQSFHFGISQDRNERQGISSAEPASVPTGGAMTQPTLTHRSDWVVLSGPAAPHLSKEPRHP